MYNFGKSDALTGALLLCGLLISTLDYEYVNVFICMIMAFFILKSTNSKSSLHMMIVLGYSTFLFFPGLMHYSINSLSLDLLLISSFIVFLILILTKNTSVSLDDFSEIGRAKSFLFWMFFFWSLLILDSAAFNALVGIFVFFTVRSFRRNSRLRNTFISILFLAVYAHYVIVYWDGFGRIVVISVVLTVLLYFLYSIGYVLNKYAFFLVLPFGSILLTGRKSGETDFHVDALLEDSAFGPYSLASGFMSDNQIIDFAGIYDQFIFTFFVFIPRSIWPEKPFGFGFEYTVRHLSDYLIEAGHSIAPTLIGDHLYFLGGFGLVTSVVVVVLIAWVSNYLYRLKSLDGFAIVLVSSNVMSLIWGGMASFSARFIFSFIVFVSVYHFSRKFLTIRTV